MPAPKFLAGLPKPVLFGLYGAVGGLVGALVFGEPLYRLLEPPKAVAEPQVAVAASKDVEVMFQRSNTFVVQVDRGGFSGPVDLSFADVPAGVAIDPVTIPKDRSEAEVTIRSTASRAIPLAKVKVIATGDAGVKKPAAETAIAVQVSDPVRPPTADVFVVIDVTQSMEWAIDGLRRGIGNFAAHMRANNVNFRVGAVAFRDLWAGEASQLLRFPDTFTADAAAFAREVGRLRADGGGDAPESTLDAVAEACAQSFRPGATKVLLVITDNPPKNLHRQGGQMSRGQTASEEEVKQTADKVKAAGIDFVHLVIQLQDQETYRPLQDAARYKDKCRTFELARAARGTGFNELVADFSREVAEAAKANSPEGKAKVAGGAERPSLKALQSEQEYEEGSGTRLALASAVWTGAVAALVCLVLLAGQHHYLRGALPAAAGVASGFLGGLAVGLVGGAAGQGLYAVAAGGPVMVKVFQVVGWALLGGLAGAGLSLFIPNLKWVHGLAGGAAGGAVGAVGFLAVAAVADEFVGRLAGGLLLGLCIGLMVAVVEAAFRRAWLEVRFGARETITVNLGPEPVKIGGDGRACTVWARGAAPLALRYFVRDGRVICEDAPTRTESVVGDGDSREVGNVSVTVRTGAAAALTPPPVPRTATPARPAATPSATAAPLSLDDDLPMPIPPQSAAPPPRPTSAPPRPPVRPPLPTAGAKPPA
ncbi:MAG TPA: vWA domain-containing protein, partial [Gemmata sp.]|nr:vWA domain-containing protein [Gemmata sp.]